MTSRLSSCDLRGRATRCLPIVPLLDRAPRQFAASIGPRDILVRDDGRIAPTYAGNKVRKLEYLLGQAVAEGFNEVWTIGAAGSNHALATALHAETLGLPVTILHMPQPPGDAVRANLSALARTRATLVHCSSTADLVREIARRRFLARTGPPSFEIPAGGSSPIGTLGYVRAALDLAASDLPPGGTVWVPAGTLGTVVGLVLGLALAGRADARVVGVRVTPWPLANPVAMRRRLRTMGALLRTLGVRVPRRMPAWRIDSGAYGDGYAIPTAAAQRAVDQASEVGLRLETTYTGKALAALLASDVARKGPPPLFWSTRNQHDIGTADSTLPDRLPRAYQPYFAPLHSLT